jgi:hypothetical protein
MTAAGTTPPWYAFAGALGALGLLFFLLPKGAPWMGLALVLGALFAAEKAAADARIPGPLADLGVAVGRAS